jgi:hypothetical protein
MCNLISSKIEPKLLLPAELIMSSLTAEKSAYNIIFELEKTNFNFVDARINTY